MLSVHIPQSVLAVSRGPYLSVVSFFQHLCPLCKDFIFLRPQGLVWPPHRAGRKYWGVNTPRAALNSGGESGWVKPRLSGLLCHRPEICHTCLSEGPWGISLQLPACPHQVPLTKTLLIGFLPCSVHLPTPLLVPPGLSPNIPPAPKSLS